MESNSKKDRKFSENEEALIELERCLKDVKIEYPSEFGFLDKKSTHIEYDDENYQTGYNEELDFGVNFMFTDYTDRTRLPPDENFYKVPQNQSSEKLKNNLTLEAKESKENQKKGARQIYFENARIPNESLPKIVNVVSCANLGVNADFEELMDSYNAEYNPKYSPALIMRIWPGTSALIFPSGKIICTGAKSEGESKDYIYRYFEKINKVDSVYFRDLRILNFEASCEIGFPIKLKEFSMTQTCFCTYIPEEFPSVIYNMFVPRVTMIISESGKIVFIKAKYS